jgi:hypothetical protein
VSHREQVVDDLEALVACRIVDGGDVAHLGVLGGGVVFEEAEDGDNAGGGDVDGEFVLPDGESEGLVISSGSIRGAGCASATTYCWIYLGRHDSRYWP